jgi:hypothetical protein
MSYQRGMREETRKNRPPDICSQTMKEDIHQIQMPTCNVSRAGEWGTDLQIVGIEIPIVKRNVINVEK